MPGNTVRIPHHIVDSSRMGASVQERFVHKCSQHGVLLKLVGHAAELGLSINMNGLDNCKHLLVSREQSI